MHEKLIEFQKVLEKCLSYLDLSIRPEIIIKPDYEPHHGGQSLPVEALIIGAKYAAFVQMGGTLREKMAGVRLERLEYEEDSKGRDKDPSRIHDGPNPYSICCFLIQDILYDIVYPISREYHNWLFKS